MSRWEGNRGDSWYTNSERVVCPYDGNHLVRRSRIQYHIIKCSQQHPEVKLEVCPYNASHRVPLKILATHIAQCPNKELLETSLIRLQAPASSASNSVSLVSSENWDDEYPIVGQEPVADSTDKDPFRKGSTVGTCVSKKISNQYTDNRDEKLMLHAFDPVQSESPEPNPQENWLNLRLPKSVPWYLKGTDLARRLGIN